MPKLSVFTPTHNPKYLNECFESLLAQPYQDWEWVVLLNHGANWSPPVEESRVRVLRCPEGIVGIGALKGLACSMSEGEILVEFDHDDILVGDCLGQIARAFDERPDVGFVYSQYAQINEDGSRCDTRFNEAMGWQYRDIDVNGQNLLQCENFPAYPSNVGYIWFAPNHVRAFRRSVYEAVGGYDPGLDVLDDQDIMCKMYVAADFHMIDECLYLQRVHQRNTQADPDINPRIQVETIAHYDRYIEPLAMAWAKRNGLHCLDLGAAHRKPEGYLGVDMYDGVGVDIVADVTKGIDLPDGSVGVIRAVDFLEHVPDKIALFNELHRLLAHGGMLLTLTPSTDGRGAFQDPTHVAYYNENSFWYFTNKQYANFVPQIQCRFQLSRMVTFYPDAWHEEHLISYVNANMISIKDGPRMAGELLI
jgi:glycosyltransferase involved in cell wall biosynthesis